MDPLTAKILITLGLQAASGIGDLVSANKSREYMQDAEDAASLAVEDAMKQAKINAEKLRTVNEDIYTPQIEATSQAASQILENVGGDFRTALALAPGLQQQVSKTQQDIFAQRQKDIQQLESDIATEEQAVAKRIQDIQLERAKGAQIAAAQYEQQRAAQMQRGFEAFGEAGAELFNYLA